MEDKFSDIEEDLKIVTADFESLAKEATNLRENLDQCKSDFIIITEEFNSFRQNNGISKNEI